MAWRRDGVMSLHADQSPFPFFESCAFSGEKIVVKHPVVELDGDEMTRIIWRKIREQVRRGRPFLLDVMRKADALVCAPSAVAIFVGPRQLILPYVQLDIKYYDLGLEHRDAVRRCFCRSPFPLTQFTFDRWLLPFCIAARPADQ